jgi:hypothetical protein
MTELGCTTGGLTVRLRSLANGVGLLLVTVVIVSCTTQGTPVAETSAAPSATSAASALVATATPTDTEV